MKSARNPPHAIKVKPLTKSELDQSFDLATRVFVEGSTLHRALGIDLETYRAYLRPSFDAMVSEGLSVVAMDPARDDVLGCLVVTAFTPEPTPIPDANDQFAPLSALTSELVARYQTTRPLGRGDAALVDMGAVAPEASGAGLYKAMRHEVNRTVQSHGFSFILGELSSAATQRVVLEQMGHRNMAEVAFADFEYQGTQPFASITQPTSLILSEGDLT